MHLNAVYLSGKEITISYHAFEMRGDFEPWEMLLKAQDRLRKAKTGEWETEINDNVIWWHSWASCSPLVVSPSTNSELKRVNFVWIGFNLSIRQYEARSMLQVFFISPQDNCIGFCKCTSTDTSVWPVDRQLVQIKNWQCSVLRDLTFWEKYLQQHMHMTTENKNKAVPSADTEKASVYGAERINWNSWKRQCIFLPLQS